MTEMDKLQYLNQRFAHRFIYGTGMVNRSPESNTVTLDIEGRMDKAKEYIDRMKEIGITKPSVDYKTCIYPIKFGELDAELSKEFTELPESYELPANAGLARARLLIENKLNEESMSNGDAKS